MGLLAVAALRARHAGRADRASWRSCRVIEEECTGNGTLAAGNAGVLGDAVVLLEPTGLDLLLGGVGRAVDRDRASRGSGPRRGGRPGGEPGALRARVILRALAEFEDEIDAGDDGSGVQRGRQALQRERRRGHRRRLGLQRARAGPGCGCGSASPAGGRRTRRSAGSEAAARRGGRPVAGRPPARGPAGGLPRRGLPARPRSPAGRRDGAGARGGARCGSAAGRPGRDDGCPLLPEPVRPARAVPTARRPATSTPSTRRSSWPASCPGRGPWPGSSPPSSPPEHGHGHRAGVGRLGGAPERSVRRAAGSGPAADRGRADRRADRHRDRARRVRARPAAAHRARAGRHARGQPDHASGRRCSGCRRPGT